jgi:hypothetical protein
LLVIRMSTVEAAASPTVVAATGGTLRHQQSDHPVTSSATDADASSSCLGHLVAVTDLDATASTTPTVRATVTDDAVIEAGGTLNVSAVYGEDPPTFADGSFDGAAAVDPDADTITFDNNHGLLTGDRVTYDQNGAATAVGGLTDGRLWRHRRWGQVLQLGALNRYIGWRTPASISEDDPVSARSGRRDRVIYSAGRVCRCGGLTM